MCREKRVFDPTIELADNAMLRHRPDLFEEWDFEKNDALGLDVYKVKRGSKIEVWWNCPKCKSEYDMPINRRITTNKRKGSNCPYCAGKRINHTNSLAALHPELVNEWHPTLNGELTPHKIAPNSEVRVWWIGTCGHEWNTVPTVRTNMKCGCPYCATSNAKPLKGFNDMWTTNPELASLLLNPEDGYKHMQRTTKKLDWKCPKCGSIIRNKKADLIQSYGLSCPNCSDGVSYPEKYVFHFLQESNIEFMKQKGFDWSQGKVYDFYLPERNWIVEVHGVQHYEENGFHTLNRSFVEEEKNDRYKMQLAYANGIEKYLVINGSISDSNHMKESIQSSDLFTLFSNIDFNVIAEKAEKSSVIEAWDLWNSGIYSTEKIANILKSNRVTVRRYLKSGQLIGKCDYTPEIAKQRKVQGAPVAVIQLSINGDFIKEWNSATEAGSHIGVDSTGITKTCRGTQKSSGGFKWMYSEDYYKEAN